MEKSIIMVSFFDCMRKVLLKLPEVVHKAAVGVKGEVGQALDRLLAGVGGRAGDNAVHHVTGYPSL